ncbi:MAG: hypothetical protein IKA98_00690, partial [Candidatus Methanomethylophilaceae archaeon]|nr:hypothetical protein [Candidatus Methanomethylophilaceae archaeon]
WSDPKTLDASTTKTALKLFNYGGDGVTYVPCTSNITAYVDVPLDAELVNVREDMTVTLIHDQVYQLDGFDPRVAWNINENGFLDNRWMREDSDVAGTWGDAGVPTNTVAYTSRDEYLVLQYRQQALLSDYPDLTNSVVLQLYHFRTHTTFPNVPLSFMAEVEGLTYEPFTHTNATMQAYWDTLRNWLPVEDEEYTGQHGADTDRDGVPDGWEVYVRSNPNSDDDASLHIDPDKLNLSQEYAGVDSCNAYSNKYDGAMLVCPAAVTITKNHPGVTDKWWNKFFPTDPHDADTDGDGLADHSERDSWKNGFPVGRNVYGATEFTFIYGDKATQEKYLENGKSTCFRGGGLNPCTVDTDGDLLPDPWEYQYAGVVFEGSNCKVTGLTENDYLTLISADEHQPGLVTNWTHQIRGGMDGTFAGDTAEKITSDANWDFDHDGLLNWQEYLVQSLRHLRYDDASTPLMGRDPDSLNFVRFMPFSSWDGKAFHNQCRIGGFPGLKSWDFRSL